MLPALFLCSTAFFVVLSKIYLYLCFNKLLKFYKHLKIKNMKTAIIETSTKALADLGWVFETDELLTDEYVEKWPVCELTFTIKKSGKMHCTYITYGTEQEKNNHESENTENFDDDYTRTKDDIEFLLKSGDAHIIEDEGIFSN